MEDPVESHAVGEGAESEGGSTSADDEVGYLAQSDSDEGGGGGGGKAPAGHRGGKQKAKLARTSEKKATRNDDSSDEHDAKAENDSKTLITEVPAMTRISDLFERDKPAPRSARSAMRKTRTPPANTDDQDDALWDTDLETDFNLVEADPTGRNTYLKACENLRVVPVSYFLRNITAPEIVMRHHGVGPQEARAMSRVLRDTVTLERLDLNGNCVTGLGALYMARMLIDNDYISELNLANNQLGSVGAYHLSKMLLVNTGLRKLDLSGNGIGDADGGFVAEAIEKNQALKELNLSHNDFGVEGGIKMGPSIGVNDIMESLDLSWNKLRRRGAIAIAKGIRDNVRLKTCNVSWNGFGPETGAAIADAIANNRALLELDISGNRLDYRAAVAIGRALKRNEELEILRIGNNPITTAGCIAIVKSVKDSDTTIINCVDFSGIPVEFEFLKLVEEVQYKRNNFTVCYGPVLWSGNTPQDIGKPAADPNPRSPLVVWKEHMQKNDFRIVDHLQKSDTENMLSVTVEQFAAALEEVNVPYKFSQLGLVVDKLDRNGDGRIYYGDFMERKALVEAQKALEADAATAEPPKRKIINQNRTAVKAKGTKTDLKSSGAGLVKRSSVRKPPIARAASKGNARFKRGRKDDDSDEESDDSDDSDDSDEDSSDDDE